MRRQALARAAFIHAIIVFLIAHTVDAAIAKTSPDGKVPLLYAVLFTALLSFRSVISMIESI